MSTVNFDTSFRATGGLQRFDCVAWVNFNGTGTVAIRASGNVSSITDNGTGDYTINFTNALPDANYAALPVASTSTGAVGNTAITANVSGAATTPKTAAAIRIWCKQGAALVDVDFVDVGVFR